MRAVARGPVLANVLDARAAGASRQTARHHAGASRLKRDAGRMVEMRSVVFVFIAVVLVKSVAGTLIRVCFLRPADSAGPAQAPVAVKWRSSALSSVPREP